MSADPPVDQLTAAAPDAVPRPVLAAGVATLAFAVACSVWVMLAALEPALAPRLGLSPVGRELLVAIPLAAGALARFPVGVLTDRYGARVMLAAIGITAAVPLAAVAFAGRVQALVAVVVAAAIAGTMFSVGAALVSRANPPGRRGRALGIFGAGTAGAALAGFTSPYLLQTDGPHTVMLLAAGALVVVAVLAVAVVRDRPAPSGVPALHAARVALRIPAVPRLAALYAVAFGTLAATGLYLPAYLHVEYRVSWREGIVVTAAFVAVAAVFRPVGGWLTDRHAGARVLVGCLATAGGCALVQAFGPPLPVAGIALVGIAASLGSASGVLLALTGILAPPARVGAVVGAVGAAGGLGGLLPPLLMVAVYAADGTFGIGLTILSAALVTAAAQVRARPEWLNAWPAPPLPAPRPSGTTVVAVAWSDIRRGTPAVAAALAELARRDELLVVHGGATNHAQRHPGHNLVAALRDRLPVHRITGMLVDTAAAANGDTDLVAELLNEGAVTIAMTPAADPAWAAVVLAEQVGADEVLQVSVARSGAVDLTPLAGTASRAVPG